MAQKLFMAALLLCLLPAAAFSGKIPAPAEQGKVLLDTTSSRAGMAPVVFDHWLHRAQFTCRVCHVDLGFAMEREATGITADLNMQGLYCGACHNGRRTFGEQVIFASCAEDAAEEEKKRCARCHSKGAAGQREYEFERFMEKFPRLPGGVAIDWEKAEEEGIITLIDFLPGISFRREPLKAREDFSIEVTTWASDVIFSHRKHAVWNGCELCHPQIFPSAKKGTVRYTMFEIMRGEYCGACHLNVAFSVWICNKCHKNPAR